jgi:hypothetical protein
MLKKPAEVELALEPAAPEAAAPIEVAVPRPTLKGFADRLLARLPGRVLLVRKAPMGEGVLVVVDNAPAELRPVVESVLADYFASDAPALHLMEQEGYRALSAFLPPSPAAPEEEAYRAALLPSPAGPSGRDLWEARRKKAQQGFAFAAKRLSLAEVVLKGGFPEEMLRPAREACAWGVTSLLGLYQDIDPAPDLPSPRLIQSELVEKKYLPDDLALRLARVRELTEPPTEGEVSAPLSVETGEAILADVRALLDLGHQRVVEAGL